MTSPSAVRWFREDVPRRRDARQSERGAADSSELGYRVRLCCGYAAAVRHRGARGMLSDACLASAEPASPDTAWAASYIGGGTKR